MNWKGRTSKRSWPNISTNPGIFLEQVKKTMKNLIQDSRSPGLDLNPGPTKYGGLLTARRAVSSFM
jgi:hypothetical protein